MQDIFNAVKGKALGVAEYLTPVLKESKFLETGVLTPEEFVAAGDHLTHYCPTWRWDAGDESARRPYLPADKQFLITKNVPCYKRVKQMEYHGEEELVEGQDGDMWVSTRADDGTDDVALDIGALDICSKPLQPARPVATVNTTEDDDDDDDDDDDEVLDMDEYMASGALDDADDPSCYVADGGATSADDAATAGLGAAVFDDMILFTRTYDVHITYDKYYQTPRLWLTGYDESRQPLSVEEMYEDFSQDHANKTITVETHPHQPCGLPMASVHPCRHAEVMKKLCSTAAENGREIQVHVYLIVFLKFMQAVIPTIEYDFTHEFSL